MKQDISGLQISMQNIFIVELLKGTFQLLENLQSLSFRQLSFIFDMFCQGATITKLIN